jgi:predicted RNase H-like HicB family nuclease
MRDQVGRRKHVDIAITTERADEKGWIAFAPEVRATAQGATEEEAKANLKALLQRYPDLLDEPRQAADRRVELIRL